MQIASKPWIAGLLLTATLACAPALACEPVYLTFDVGNMRHAEAYADFLRDRNLKATFFIANNKTTHNNKVLDDAWGPFWKRLVAEGHNFGNHTWSHHYARRDNGQVLELKDRAGKPLFMQKADYCRELQSVNERFKQLTGKNLAPAWRAPGGKTTPNSLQWAAQCGYPRHVGWSEFGYAGDDWPDRFSNAFLVKRVVDNLKAGDTLLFHLGIWDRKSDFFTAFPELMEKLERKGFCFRQLELP